jgi:murein endopeptidase
VLGVSQTPRMPPRFARHRRRVALLLLLATCPAGPGAASAIARPPQHGPDCAGRPSWSIGSPGHGRLEHGVLFPAVGPDHFAWNFREQRIGGSDRTRWGNCRVVRAALRGLALYRSRNPDAPLVAVGDMGLRHGGPIDRHATHQNGRQIDIYYPRRDRRHREPHTIAQVDMRLSRELVRAMLDVGAYRVLVGPHIQIRMSARVMRWPNHDDHLHAIF